MIIEKQELMISPHKNGDFDFPNYRKSHFLKPTLDPNFPLPKPPSLTISSNFNISLLKSMVSFYCRTLPNKNWVIWVDTLLQTHEIRWKKVGIFDSILSTTYNIKSNNELIFVLAEKWCVETNTFVFPFGEATITLEDVVILGGFSVLGECVRKTRVEIAEVEEMEVNLMSFFRKDGEGLGKLVQHCEWIEHFMGFGGEIELVAFLVLWLSKFVFPRRRFNGYISLNLLPIAIALARGTKVALAPAILAAIYRDLGLLKAKLVNFKSGGKNDESEVVLCAPFQLVQLWVWERFTVLSPKPVSGFHCKPRLARWKPPRNASICIVRPEFESLGDRFLWKPYALNVLNNEFSELYCDEGKFVSINSDVSENLASFARCLMPCELVGIDCIEQYLPHRVGMQFGLDQDIPCYVERRNHSLEEAWSSYNKPLDGELLVLPPRMHNGEVTTRYYNWWRTDLCSLKSPSRRRSKRIAKISSRNSNKHVVGKYDNRATVSLSSSSKMHNEAGSSDDEHPANGEIVSSQPMCIDSTPLVGASARHCENMSQHVDRSFKVTVETGSSSKQNPTVDEIVPCLTKDDFPEMPLCLSTTLVSRYDEMRIDDKAVYDCENLFVNDTANDDMYLQSQAPCLLLLYHSTASAEHVGETANVDTSPTGVCDGVEDPIVIPDEETENGDRDRILAMCRELESRISTLEENSSVIVAAVAGKTRR